MRHAFKQTRSIGFTILELIVVVGIIGILTTVVVVTYGGSRAKANDVSLLSDIDTLDTMETNYGLKHSFPKVYHSTSGYDSDLDFTPSNGNVIDVFVDNADYCIRAYNTKATKNSKNNAYTKESNSGVCSRLILKETMTELGFIPVPGSATYGTSDFYVMKYEASCIGCNGVALSRPGLTPVGEVSRASALSWSAAACDGCHLMTEAEWMTIAQNVLSVSSNWSGGAVGSGYIYSGNNDGNPSGPNAQVASANDSDSYYLTNNFAGDSSVTNGMVGNSQRRTLTLTNGEVIWDMAGNQLERTSDQVTTGQPGINGAGYAWREWTAITTPGSLPVNPFPSSTGISGSNLWNSSKGIGMVYSNANETALKDFFRGGSTNTTPGYSGVLALNLSYTSGTAGSAIGFRAAR